MRNHSPYHNRPSPVSIPLENASVGKPFPTASVQTTSPVSTKKGEPGLICEENTSPLPHWKASRSRCCYSSHTTRAGCPIEWQTDVGRRARRPNSRKRFLPRTSGSGLVCDPSSFPQTSDKTFYGGNMHTEMPSDLPLPLPLH